jgi:hypothetical protein
MLLPHLNFPEYDFKLQESEGTTYIFDRFRRKKVVLTPEEWVRQNLLVHLCEGLDYPHQLIGVENGLRLNKMSRRTDAMVYKEGKAIMLIECKADYIPLNQEVFDQICRYNQIVKAQYLLLTNGNQHIVGCLQSDRLSFLPNIPKYHEL